jgi:hypothetical protein
MRTDYDSPWKTMLTAYFADCLAFYFPQAHQQIDWRIKPIFLDKELAKLRPNDQSQSLHVDQLARIQLLNGEPGWVLLHLEIQSQRDSQFAERLYRYNSRIYSSYQRRVATLAILADDVPQWRPQQFAYELLGCQVSLDFPVAKLLDYKAEAEALLNMDNPFALVTFAHLQALATNPDDWERQVAKFRLVRLLYERGYSRQEVINLFRFIDWVLQLTPELEEVFDEALEQLEKEKKMTYISSLERRAISRGVEQGRVETGRVNLLLLLQSKFSVLPPVIVTYIQTLEDADHLQLLFNRALTAVSLDDMDILPHPDEP